VLNSKYSFRGVGLATPKITTGVEPVPWLGTNLGDGNREHLAAPPVTSRTTLEEFKMKKVIVSLAFGASALLATAASAAPLSTALRLFRTTVSKNVRMVCDEYGRLLAGTRFASRYHSRFVRLRPARTLPSTGVDTMTEDTTMMGRASESALVRAA